MLRALRFIAVVYNFSGSLFLFYYDWYVVTARRIYNINGVRVPVLKTVIQGPRYSW